MVKVTIDVTSEMARALKDNPGSVRMTGVGADGVTRIERAKPEPQPLDDEAALALLKAGKLRAFQMFPGEEAYTFIELEGVPVFLSCCPNAVEATFDEVEKGMKACPAGWQRDTEWEEVDPLGLGGGEVRVLKIEHDEICDVYSNNQSKAFDHAVSLMQVGKLRCFYLKKPMNYYLKPEAVDEFLKANPEAVEQSAECMQSWREKLRQERLAKQLARSASGAISKMKPKMTG